MRKFLVKRTLLSILILFFVTFIIYVLMRCLPASYVETMAQQLSQAPGSKPYEEWLAQLNAQYGLDLDLIPGFFVQLKNLITGNFGDSWKYTVPVLQKFNEVIWVSFIMGAISLVFELLIAVPLGIVAATKQYSVTDYTVTTVALLGMLFILSFHWGVAGAAIATVAAQLISTLGCFLYAFLKYPELRLHREDWRITRRDVTRHLIQGIPLGLQFSVLAIGIIVMQSVIVQFDTLGGEMVSNAAQNGFGAANKLNNLLMTPLNGLGAAMTSFTAQNLGAGDHARIKKGTVQALIIVWTMCLISIAAGLLLSRGGGYLYIFLSPDKVTAETMRYGNTYLYVDLSLYLFLGFIFVVRNCMQGIGKPQFVLGAGAAELAARVSVCLLLPPLIAGGAVNSDAPRAAVYALCFADPFAWMAADAVLLVPFLRNIMKMDYRYLKGTM